MSWFFALIFLIKQSTHTFIRTFSRTDNIILMKRIIKKAFGNVKD
jgi:hypothetical protein